MGTNAYTQAIAPAFVAVNQPLAIPGHSSLAAPQYGMNPGDNLFRNKRLDHVIVRPAVQARQPVRGVR
ncbi:hypothetical protein ACL02P_01795 [Paenibacillus sp. MB22_1]|uniref:hypothetical protein n=1 Tax=Paenibacillus TaxID=44249 RepID=UPI00056CBCD8